MKEREGETLASFLRKEAEEFEIKHPVLYTHYKVYEVKPAYNTGGYYDEDIPEERIARSPNFDSKEEAEAWVDKFEPDDGWHFEIMKCEGREFVYREIKWFRKRV